MTPETEGSIILFEKCIGAFLRPLLSAHTAACRTRTMVRQYDSTTLRVLRPKLLHRVLDLEILLNSVKRSNPLRYGRITYMADLHDV